MNVLNVFIKERAARLDREFYEWFAYALLTNTLDDDCPLPNLRVDWAAHRAELDIMRDCMLDDLASIGRKALDDSSQIHLGVEWSAYCLARERLRAEALATMAKGKVIKRTSKL